MGAQLDCRREKEEAILHWKKRMNESDATVSSQLGESFLYASGR